jgi:catechol 2,3-dioxygenase-like lactoylglutathione lyase family enzyme
VSVIAFRNVVRYVKDLDRGARCYVALGFHEHRRMGDMVVLVHPEGLKLVLHAWNDPRPTHELDTALGFTMTGDVAAARRFVEAAGCTLLRAPDESDAGFFYIYADPDGNPINLVGRPGGKA